MTVTDGQPTNKLKLITKEALVPLIYGSILVSGLTLFLIEKSTFQVHKVNSEDGCVKSVETSHGNVKCEYFINSAGKLHPVHISVHGVAQKSF